MNEAELETRIARAAEQIPVGPPATTQIMKAGSERQRRRTAQRAIVGAGATVVAISLGMSYMGSQPTGSKNGPDRSAGNPSAAAADTTSSGLPCAAADRRVSLLDLPGPGKSTPESAVETVESGAKMVERPVSEVESQIDVFGQDLVVRTYSVVKRNDGWWVESFSECSTK